MTNRPIDTKSHRRMPVWEVVDEYRQEIRGKERLCLELQCAYCQRNTVVEKRQWFKRDEGANNGLTRPCIYCFRASYMPDALAYAHKQGWDLSL